MNTPAAQPSTSSKVATAILDTHRKFSAATVGGALVVVGVWALHQFAHLVQPPEVIAAETVLVTTLIYTLVPGADS